MVVLVVVGHQLHAVLRLSMRGRGEGERGWLGAVASGESGRSFHNNRESTASRKGSAGIHFWPGGKGWAGGPQRDLLSHGVPGVKK